jgi:hypothetical protein
MKWIRTLLSNVASYVNRSASEAHRWFRAGDTFWVWLALTIVILLAFYVLPSPLPDRVRWAGTLFEFLGVSAVVIGIDRARRSFGRPSVLQGMWIWLGESRFIVFRRPPISASVNISMGIATATGVGTVVVTTTKSTEERVAQLEKEVTDLRTNIGDVDRKVDQQKREFRADLDKEAAARQAGDQGVSKKLEEGMVGDSPFELAGVFYVCLGLAMAHLSEEVALGLGWLGLT